MKYVGFLLFSIFIQAQLQAQFCFSPITHYPAGDSPFGIVSADFNNDGKADIATSNQGSKNTSVYLSNDAGGFSISTFTVNGYPPDITAGDFNNDGDQDLALGTIGWNTTGVNVLFGNGAGNFSTAVFFVVNGPPWAITHGDFNGDGNLDIATGNELGGSISVLLGNGAGNFSPAVNYPASGAVFGVTSGDFNNDGYDDVACNNMIGYCVSIFISDGSGGFLPTVNFPEASSAWGVVCADLNSDGNIDLVTGNIWDVSILWGNGNGAFSAPVNYSLGKQCNSIAVADFNGDGKKDIVAGTYGGPTSLSFLLGDGLGNFTMANKISYGYGPAFVTANDFNGDGKQDIATGNGFNNNITVLMNEAPGISISGSNTLCAGNTLTAGGALTYTWATPGLSGSTVSVSPNTIAVYSVLGSNMDGCVGAATKTINVLALPDVNISSSSNPVCYGETVTLTATGANTYVWSNSLNNGNTISVNPIITTIYSVKGTDANGCENETSFTLELSECVGIKEIANNNAQFLIYPNPNNGQCFVTAENDMDIRITNELGNLVRVMALNESNDRKLMLDLENGIYFLSTKDINRKLIVFK